MDLGFKCFKITNLSPSLGEEQIMFVLPQNVDVFLKLMVENSTDEYTGYVVVPEVEALRVAVLDGVPLGGQEIEVEEIPPSAEIEGLMEFIMEPSKEIGESPIEEESMPTVDETPEPFIESQENEQEEEEKAPEEADEVIPKVVEVDNAPVEQYQEIDSIEEEICISEHEEPAVPVKSNEESAELLPELIVPRCLGDKWELWYEDDRIVGWVDTIHSFKVSDNVLWLFEDGELVMMVFDGSKVLFRVALYFENDINSIYINEFNPFEVVIKTGTMFSKKYFIVRYDEDAEIIEEFECTEINHKQTPVAIGPGAYAFGETVFSVDRDGSTNFLFLGDDRETKFNISGQPGILVACSHCLHDFCVDIEILTFNENYTCFVSERKAFSIVDFLSECDISVFSGFGEH
ncbi:hypothetical protein PCE1_002862 [Barthelona sp. PCE]